MLRSSLLLVVARILKSLIAVLVPAGALSAQPPQIGVSPSLFEIDLDADRGATHSFRVHNYGERPVEMELSSHNWELGPENQVQVLEPTEQSLDQWLIINPVRFVVAPKADQVVRFSVRPRVELTAGEHRAILYLEQLPDPDKPVSSFGFRLRLGMAVYGYVGEIERRAELHSIDVGENAARFDITSLGNANVRLNGQYAIWHAAEYPGEQSTSKIEHLGLPEQVVPDGVLAVEKLPSRPVLPGFRRTLTVNLPQGLEPGEYVLDLNGTLADLELDRAIPFTVARPQPSVEVATQ